MPPLSGEADHATRLSDQDFAAAFGLGEFLDTKVDKADVGADANTLGVENEGAPDGASDRLRDPETGRFVARSENDNTATERESSEDVAGAAREAGEGEAADEEESGAEAGSEPNAALTAPVTDFVVEDSGEAVDVPSTMTIKFTANGEERSLPLDKVVRLAKMGFYNEAKEQQYQQIHERNAQLEPLAREAFQRAAYLEQFLEGVLKGDEQADQLLFDARTRYAEENTPEAENRRLRAQLEAARSGVGVAQAANPAQQFAAVLAPKLDALVKQHPNLTEKDVWSHFERMTAPYMDRARGTLDPIHYQTVLTLVDGALAHTLEILSDHKGEMAARVKRAEEEAKITKGKLRLVKRAQSSGMKPGGGSARSAPVSGPTAPVAPRSERPEDVNEALIASIAQELQSA